MALSQKLLKWPPRLGVASGGSQAVVALRGMLSLMILHWTFSTSGQEMGHHGPETFGAQVEVTTSSLLQSLQSDPQLVSTCGTFRRPLETIGTTQPFNQ